MLNLNLSPNSYRPYPKWFGHIRQPMIWSDGTKYDDISWYSCRELFHSNKVENVGKRKFLFHAGCRKTNIFQFISRIEDILKVPKDKRLTYEDTNLKNVVLINIEGFWAVKVRVHLLSILLRAGSKYSKRKDNWTHVIESTPYLKRTKDAVNKFLQGYTQLTPHVFFGGWVSTFGYPRYNGGNIKYLKKRLRAKSV